jgi:O-antigen/teichoic acid export membrane protein
VSAPGGGLAPDRDAPAPSPDGGLVPDQGAGPAGPAVATVGRLTRLRALAARPSARSVLWGLGLQATVAISGILAARLLGPDDRGRLALLWVVAIAAGQLATLGLPTAITYALGRGSARGDVLGRVRSLLLLQSAVAGAVAIGCGVWIGTADEDTGLLAALVVTPAAIAVGPLLLAVAVAQGEQRATLVQLARSGQAIAYAGALLVLVAVGTDASVAGVGVVWSATLVLATVVLWVLILRRPSREPAAGVETPSRRAMLRFGLLGMFGAIGAAEHLMLDQLLFGLLLTPREFGYLVAGAAFANLPRFLGQSLGLVAYPDVAGAGDRARAVARRHLLAGSAVVGGATLGVLALVPVALPLLFGEPFRPAVDAALLLVAAGGLHALRRIGSEVTRGLGRPGVGSVGEASFLVVGLTLGILLLDDGAVGAAAGLLAGTAVGLAVVVVAIVRIYRAETTSSSTASN